MEKIKARTMLVIMITIKSSAIARKAKDKFLMIKNNLTIANGVYLQTLKNYV